MSFPEESPVEVSVDGFDPLIHRVDDEGNPIRNKNGTYAKKRGRKPGQRVTSRGGSKQTVDYRPGINGLLQGICVPLSIAAPADAYAVATHGPNIATALNQLAQERPEVAAMLEKVLAIGPYGALVAATIPMIIQIAHNHNAVPEQLATAMGATPKRVIMNSLRARAEQWQQEQSEDTTEEHAYATV
jgi:hypothetical protein